MINLNQDQLNARQAIIEWLADTTSDEPMVLSGYAGVGKSTMLGSMIDDWAGTEDLLRQINPDYTSKGVVLTATTNKACRALELAMGIGVEAKTVQSHFKLQVKTNMSSGAKYLVPKHPVHLEDQFLIVDEASMIDEHLLTLIAETAMTRTKILFIGDPTQLTPVKSTSTPVFNQGLKTVYLTQVMRQSAGNPIAIAADSLRDYVLNPTGEFPFLELVDPSLIWMEKDAFCAMLKTEFSDPDWTANTSKVLAWKNDTVKRINEWVREEVEGHPQLQVGDIAVVNRYQNKTGIRLVTDAIVMIDTCRKGHYNVKGTDFPGSFLTVESNPTELFVPDNLKDYDKAIKLVLGTRDLYTIQADWADIRAAYACTIHKSQGSSLDKIFLDLGDFNSNVPRPLLARLLYVAISRARHQVVLTGDISWL